MNDYWQKRIEEALARRDEAAAKALPELLSHMQEAKRSLEKEVNAFYARYAKNNRVSLAEARRALTLSELADFRGDIKTFRELAKKSIGTFDLEVENLSVKARITRLQALEAQCDAILQKCCQAQRELIGKTAANLAQEQYLHRLYDIERYTGFQFQFSQLPASRVRKMLEMPVNGADISASLWRQDIDAGFQIRRVLNNMFTTGRPPQDFAKELQRIIGRRDAGGSLTGKSYEAYRLLYNEAAHITEQANMQAMIDDGLDQYEVTAALDAHTCGRCQEQDGKIYDCKKAAEGVNMPPFHVNCRCTTVPYIPEAQGDYTPMRAARDPVTGKTVRTKAQTYEEWKAEREKSVEKQSELTNAGKKGILDTSKAKEVSDVHTVGRIDINKYRCVTDDIVTDEVIITDERIRHIKERHPGDYERYVGYISRIVGEPDYIIEANKANSAVVLKEIEENGEKFKVILRLKIESDPKEYRNSIISFWRIGETTWKKAIKNKKILYKKE